MFSLLPSTNSNIKNDFLSGLTVSLALVPEAVAFALIVGVNPLVGLYAAFTIGLVTALVGGRPGMISGATGALAVVMVSLVSVHGLQYLFAAVILMGILQILAGILRVGLLIRMIPYPVMLGFVNGLAIVIFLAQLQQFKVTSPSGELMWLQDMQLYTLLFFVMVTMAIIHFLPYLTKAVPSSLVAIITVTLISLGFHFDLKTVGDIASIKGGLPTFNVPSIPFTFETLVIILPYSIIFAAIGLIESLLTLQLIDDITETTGKSNRECIGQGVANVVTGFFGGMGGCAMIGQSMINIKSGGLGRLSGITAAVMLMFYILFGSAIIEMIPVAALVGVMLMVVLGTFEWSSFRIIGKIPRSDAFVLIAVSIITVFTDLAVAVIIGVFLSAVTFAWKAARHMDAKISVTENKEKIYELHGPLFFSSVSSFHSLFTPEDDPLDVVIDFRYTRVHDHSGIEAIESLSERYIKRNKKLHLRNLSPECIGLLSKASSLVESNQDGNPNYHVASMNLV